MIEKFYLGSIIIILITLTCMKNINSTYEEKEQFINMILKLEHKSDKYTEESVNAIEGWIPVLLNITNDDFSLYLKRHHLDPQDADMYPLIILSLQLTTNENDEANIKNIKYFILNFSKLPESKIKDIWLCSSIYFNFLSNEVVNYYIKMKKDSKRIKEMNSLFGNKWKKIEFQVSQYINNKS